MCKPNTLPTELFQALTGLVTLTAFKITDFVQEWKLCNQFLANFFISLDENRKGMGPLVLIVERLFRLFVFFVFLVFVFYLVVCFFGLVWFGLVFLCVCLCVCVCVMYARMWMHTCLT